MQYELYLKYDATISIGLHGHWGDLCQHNWADIMYWENNENVDVNDDEDEGVKIGILNWVNYNQALAMAHGVNMTNIPFLSMQRHSIALLDLDYTNISQETIDEIGTASNPNIVLLLHFGISAAYRKRGFGEEIMKGFIEEMKGKCGYIVIVHNEPAQLEKYKRHESLYVKQGVELDGFEKDPGKAQWKLNAFWQRCGFRRFKDYDNAFICNVDQAVPERRHVNVTTC